MPRMPSVYVCLYRFFKEKASKPKRKAFKDLLLLINKLIKHLFLRLSRCEEK